MVIELTAAARKKLAPLREQFGMTQLAIMSRLVNWFTSQKDSAQRAFLYRGDSSHQEAALKQVFQELAAKNRK